MGAGQFLSERAVHQMDRQHSDNLLIGGGLMFGSYLFALGYIKDKVVQSKPLRSGFEILLIGGAATLLGLLAGWIFQTT